jgi:hypothetical protein
MGIQGNGEDGLQFVGTTQVPAAPLSYLCFGHVLEEIGSS